jgi:hypothetical protein
MTQNPLLEMARVMSACRTPAAYCRRHRPQSHKCQMSCLVLVLVPINLPAIPRTDASSKAWVLLPPAPRSLQPKLDR